MLFLLSFASAAATETCYAVHGAYESIANHGDARTFDNVTFAISDTANLLKSEYKWKGDGGGYETSPSNNNWNVFNDKTSGDESYFFMDAYSNPTKISGTVYVSAESKDKLSGGQFNWTLYEYDPSDGSIVYTLGSQIWDGTGADDPIDSQLSISDHVVSVGNRLMVKVTGKLDDYTTFTTKNDELKFKIDEAGAETATTITTNHCSNIHGTYKSFFVMAITEEIVSPPIITNVTVSATTIKGGNVLTVYANTTSNGVNDTDLDTLQLFCDGGSTPTSVNTNCTGGSTLDSTYPYALTCAFATSVTSVDNFEYCRLYDGSLYSEVVTLNYTTDSTSPILTLDSVAGDITASYYDLSNDGLTEINATGEANMTCRWSSTDLSYDSMSNACTIDGTTANCNANDVASQGFTTRYIACQDQYGNKNSAANNLEVSFFLDYAAPSTSDDSSSAIVAPDYTVTINEADVVDSDPTTLYCTDILGVCVPSFSIDDLGTIIFTSANRGINYLRYRSSDDAGNIQAVQNKTINLNQLPVFTSASDNVTTIGGGEMVNITSISNDADSQDLTMWVCDSTSVSPSGCGGTEYCNATNSNNLTCSFTSESDSASHTWYAFLYDALGEMSAANATGSYTSDVTSPGITLITPTNDSTITQSSVTFTALVDEALSMAWYSLDEGVTNVTMTNSSLLVYTNTNSSIADGNYSLTFWANDSYGNLGNLEGNSFSIDTAVPDTTAPTITVQVPVNNTYYTSASVLLNITTDEDLSWAGYSINGSVTVALGNTTMTFWNATYAFVEGTNNVTFYANDSSDNQGTKSVNLYVDLTNPAVNFSCLDATKSEDIVCSLNASDAIELDYAIISWNSTGSWQNSSQISLSGTSSTESYTILAGNTSVGTFSTQAYVFDSSERLNSSETDIVTVSDNSFPQINNITYVPNTTAALDDGVSVNINATITEDYNISSVYLMYQNSSASEWTYLLMGNNSALVVGGSSEVVYNGTLTLAEETWTIKINATDYAENTNVSSEYELVVADDTTFWNSTDITAIESFTYAQRAENNTLGTLLLNNTGDTALNFLVNISSDIESRFDVNYSSSQDAAFAASAADNLSLTMLVNTTGLTSGLYDYNVTVSSAAGTTLYENKLNIQTATGPYLEVVIGTYSSSVTRGQEDVSLVATVSNLGTQDAQNVYLNWTLPTGFSLDTGSLTRSLGTIPIGGSGSNSITFDVSSDLTNSSLEIIANASATTLNATSTSKDITISDPVTVTVTETVTTSGGGGGGSSGGGGASIVYDKIVEVVRGEETFFEIEIENPYVNSTLKDLNLELEGFLEQYLVLKTTYPRDIEYGEVRKIRVDIFAPSYKSYEEHDLKVTIKGTLSKSDKDFAYKEVQNIKLIIQEVSQEEATGIFDEAEQAILDMKEKGLNTIELENLLKTSNSSLANYSRYKDSYDLSQEILLIKSQADESEDLLYRVLSALENPRKSNLLVGNVIGDLGKYDANGSIRDLLLGKAVFASPEVQELLELSVVAFERGGYEVSLERAKEARNLLVLERKGNFWLFLYLNWQYIILNLIVLMFLGFVWHRHYEKRSIGRRIVDINHQEENIRKNEVENQNKYFNGKKDVSSYKAAVRHNGIKLSKLKKERLNLRNKRIKLLKPREIISELNSERKEIENEVRKIQREYYQTRKISEKQYDLQFEALNERLAEIEDETTTLELMKTGKGRKNKVKKSNAKKIAKKTRKGHKKMKNTEVKKRIKKTLEKKK